MGGKSLVGALNNTTARAKYTGGVTDSLRIVVDNSTMTIKGDVIWSNALGEIASRAYPGDKGARNYAAIQELTSKLDYELSESDKFRSSSSSELKTLKKLLTEVQQQLEDETCRASKAENKLHAKTTREIDRSITTDNELFTRIEEESSARKKSGSEMITLITSIKGEVVEESNRAQSIEFALNEKIDDVEDRLKLENFDLQGQLLKLTTTVDSEVVKSTITDGTTHIYAVTGNVQHTIPVSCKDVSDSIVKRDQYGNIHLSEKMPTVATAAVSKMYVDSAIADVNSALLSRFEGIEFIDGGNAPI